MPKWDYGKVTGVTSASLELFLSFVEQGIKASTLDKKEYIDAGVDEGDFYRALMLLEVTEKGYLITAKEEDAEFRNVQFDGWGFADLEIKRPIEDRGVTMTKWEYCRLVIDSKFLSQTPIKIYFYGPGPTYCAYGKGREIKKGPRVWVIEGGSATPEWASQIAEINRNELGIKFDKEDATDYTVSHLAGAGWELISTHIDDSLLEVFLFKRPIED